MGSCADVRRSGSLRAISGIFCYSPCYLLRRGAVCTGRPLGPQDLPVPAPQQCPFRPFRYLLLHPAFTRMLETRTQFCVIAQQMLYPLSHFLIPGLYLLIKFIGAEQQRGNSAGKELAVKQEDLVQSPGPQWKERADSLTFSEHIGRGTHSHVCAHAHK